MKAILKSRHLPSSALGRRVLGVVLVFLGFFGFLPIIGFWMIPLGLVVLSIDSPFVRRRRRQVEVWWGRRKAKLAAKPGD